MIVDDGVFTINAATSFDVNAPFSSFAGGKVVCYDGLGVMNEITLNSNSVNTAGGLVVVGDNGKIPANLYDGGSSFTAGPGIDISTDNQISFNPSTYTEPFYLSSGIDEDNRTYISSGGYQNGIKLGFEADKYLPSIEIRNNLMIISCSYNSSLIISNNAIYYSNGNHLLAPHVDTPWETVKSSYVANYGGADASGWIARRECT